MKKRKDGRYSAQVVVGKVDGKKKYKTVYGKTQREVNEKIATLKIQRGKGINLIADENSFEFWCDLLIHDKKSSGVSQKQIKNLLGSARSK